MRFSFAIPLDDEASARNQNLHRRSGQAALDCDGGTRNRARSTRLRQSDSALPMAYPHRMRTIWNGDMNVRTLGKRRVRLKMLCEVLQVSECFQARFKNDDVRIPKLDEGRLRDRVRDLTDLRPPHRNANQVLRLALDDLRRDDACAGFKSDVVALTGFV